MRLEINRAKWLRGEGGTKSGLLRRDGKRCCLGFFAQALGARDDDVAGCSTPEDATHIHWPEWLLSELDDSYIRTVDSDEAIALIRINDNRALSDAERESVVASIFARHGVEVVFIDEDV